MNYGKNVVIFSITATAVMLCLSFYFTYTGTDIFLFKNVNIISDVFELSAPTPPAKVTVKLPVQPRKIRIERDFSDYARPHIIMHFGYDTSISSLPKLANGLSGLKNKKSGKVRIGWFGDSMIEGDLLTQTFRKRMQEFFGGCGVGFVPAQSVSNRSRSSVTHTWTGDWKEENLKDKEFNAPIFLSGHAFYTGNGTVNMTDHTLPDTNKTQVLEKYLFCGSGAGDINIQVNDHIVHGKPVKAFNCIQLDASTSHRIQAGINNEKLPVYGISFEPVSGVLVDNFSFRGITGVELVKLDSNFLAYLDQQHYYDLIVIEYGANLMFRPNDRDYGWYRRMMDKSLKRLKRAMPHTEFLMISSGDRAFKYDDVWKSAVGVDSVVKTQAMLARDNDMAFYNMFSSMGGTGTIVSWADSTPALANKDYVHPNHRGAEILGNMFFEDLLKEVNKTNKIQKQL